MASTNKTDKLKLNKWLGSDKIQRVDFNNDNDIIEQEFLDRGINVKWFNAKGDNSNDDTSSIQSALDSLSNGGILLIPQGTYRITSTLFIKYSNIHIVGIGNPKILWDGVVGGIPLKIDKSTYNSNVDYSNMQIKNLTIDGNDKTLWTLWIKGFTSRCKLENVYLTKTVGFIYNEDCWYSSYEHLYCWGQYDGLPSGMNLTDWQSVHNSLSSAPIVFKNANSVSIKHLHTARMGTSLIPSGGTKTKQYIYLTGHNTTIEDVSFELSRGYESSTISSDIIFTFDYGSNVIVNNVYMENIHVDYLTKTNDYFMNTISFKKIFGGVCTINTRCFNLNKAINFELDGLMLNNAKLNSSNSLVVYSADTYATYTVKNLDIHEGANVVVNSKIYSNAGVGQLGVTSGVTWTKTNKLPKILNGLTVTSGSDATSNYVLIDTGALLDGNGEVVHFGYNTFSPIVEKVGWLLRPSATATTWNVCIDTFGCVFLENTASMRTNVNRGKVILATFTTDATGVISGLTTINNTYNGHFINGTTNRRVYLNAAPTTDAWIQGDEIINTTPTASGYRGWVCVTAGSPGTFKGFGTIQA